MKQAGRLLLILLLSLLMILALVRLGDIEISWRTLSQINPWYFALAGIIHYSGFLMRGWRWQVLLGALGHPLRYTYTTALLISGWFVSALLPARAGDWARVYLLQRDHQIAYTQGLASIATERVLDIMAILFLASLACLWALADKTPPWVWQSIGGGLILLCLLGLGLLLSARLETWFKALFAWSWYQKLLSFVFDLVGHIRHLSQDPKRLLIFFLQSFYIWLCDILLMAFALLSLDAVYPLSVSAVSAMLADLAAAVPLVPGAVGQFEGAALFSFSLFGVGTQISSLVLLLNRFISFWSFLLFSALVTYYFGFSQILALQKPSDSAEHSVL